MTWVKLVRAVLSPRNILAVFGVASLVYFAVSAVCSRSRGIPAKGRIVLTEPAPRFEPPPDFAVSLPDSNRADRTEPGPSVEVATRVPVGKKAAKEIEERFHVDVEEEPILALKDFPSFCWGGDLVVTEKDGRAGVTMRGFERPFAEWRPTWWAGVGGEFTPDGPGLVAELRLNPFRVGHVYPEVSGGWSESRRWYVRGMAGVSW